MNAQAPAPRQLALLCACLLPQLIACTDIKPKGDGTGTTCNSQHLCHGAACGAPCESADDCEEGWVCFERNPPTETGFCTTPCDAGGPFCGCDFYCGPRTGEESDYYCLNEPPCTDDDECLAADAFCTDLRPVCDADGCRRQPFCGAAVCDATEQGCSGPTEPCTDGSSCYSGLCLGYDPPRCHAHCDEDADCEHGSVCLPVTVDLQDGTIPVVMGLCVLLGPPCERDEDCSDGKICGTEVSMTPTCVSPLCQRGDPDCRDSGQTCGDRDACYNRVCLGSGEEFFCHEFCREGHHEDCDVEGQICRKISTLAGVVHACVTAGLPCKRDEDCPEPGQVCGIGRTLDPECRAQAGEPSLRVGSGDACNLTDQICFNNLCLGQMVGDEFQGTCYELCDPEQESSQPTCPEDQNCRVVRIKVAEGDIVVLDVCTVY